MIEVEWTVTHYLDQVTSEGPSPRGRQILRLVDEAAAAGAAPTVSDLAGALAVSGSTVRREIEALRRDGYEVNTRGRRR